MSVVRSPEEVLVLQEVHRGSSGLYRAHILKVSGWNCAQLPISTLLRDCESKAYGQEGEGLDPDCTSFIFFFFVEQLPAGNFRLQVKLSVCNRYGGSPLFLLQGIHLGKLQCTTHFSGQAVCFAMS